MATRLPPEYRLSAADAAHLIQHEVLDRMSVSDVTANDREAFLNHAVQDGAAGGRIYDAHIAEGAQSASAAVIVTDNRRHFLTALRHGIRVETPAEFAAALRKKAR